MDFERAQQIIKANENIDVMLNGSPVWIESISQKDKTAKVTPLDGVSAVTEVPVENLMER